MQWTEKHSVLAKNDYRSSSNWIQQVSVFTVDHRIQGKHPTNNLNQEKVYLGKATLYVRIQSALYAIINILCDYPADTSEEFL